MIRVRRKSIRKRVHPVVTVTDTKNTRVRTVILRDLIIHTALTMLRGTESKRTESANTNIEMIEKVISLRVVKDKDSILTVRMTNIHL